MDREIGGVRVRSSGWKEDGLVVIAVLCGALCIIASFWVPGWARLGLQLLGGVLAAPLVAFVCLLFLGGAVSGLTKPKPSVTEWGALVVAATGLGGLVGSYAPSAPQELLITPAGLLASAFIVRGGRVRQPGVRRRIAGAITLVVAAAGVIGLWLLVNA